MSDPTSTSAARQGSATPPANAEIAEPAREFQRRRGELTEAVDAAILEAIDRHCGDAPKRLREAIRYSWTAPGKRLRPMLALLAAEAVGAPWRAAMPAAVAVEAIHCYSLIHDDLPAMDDDDLRRGRPTCHVRFDEATAILAGDALQPLAFAVLAVGYRDPAVIARSVALLSEAAGACQLVGGQAEDIEAEGRGWQDAELLSRIHRRKTGAMIRVSVELGGLAGGADDAGLQRLTAFGEAVGLAFQIVDDLLDVQSDSQAMGKRTGKDAARGKLTYPGVYGVEASREKAAELMRSAVDAAGPLGPAAGGLLALARFVYERDS